MLNDFNPLKSHKIQHLQLDESKKHQFTFKTLRVARATCHF